MSLPKQSSGGGFIDKIPVIGGVASAILNPILQGAQNRKNRKFAVKRYNVERQDALSDWERQNLYNSPTEWRKRQEEAGINPFYTGQSAGSGATPVSSTKSSSAEGRASQLQMGEYFTAKRLGLETEMMRANVNKIQADTEAVQLSNEKEKGLKEGVDYDGNHPDKRVFRQIQTWATDIAVKESTQQQSDAQANLIRKNKEKLDKQLLILDREIALPEGTFKSDSYIDREMGPMISQILKANSKVDFNKAIRFLKIFLYKLASKK